MSVWSVSYTHLHDGKVVLLPDIPDCVKEVDDENKIITVHIMKGLLDL